MPTEAGSSFADRSIQLLAPAILWFGRRLLKWNRLDRIDRIKLGSSIEDAVKLYGAAHESKPDDHFSEAIQHTFAIGFFHSAVICEWHGRIHLVTYWSANPEPMRDLACMLETYGEGIGWNETEPGHWHFRNDGRIRLWCSAAPAIGVATTKFLEASGHASSRLRSSAPDLR